MHGIDETDLLDLTAQCEKLGVGLDVYDEHDGTVEGLRERTTITDGTFLLLSENEDALTLELFSKVFIVFYRAGYWLSSLPGLEDDGANRNLAIAFSRKKVGE